MHVSLSEFKYFFSTLLLVWGLVMPGMAQSDQEADSLVSLIDRMEASPERIDARIALAELLYRSAPEEALSVAEQAQIEANELDYPLGEAYAYRLMGLANRSLGNNQETLINYDMALELFSIARDSLGLGKIFNSFGTYFFGQGNLITAKSYYERSIGYLQDQNATIDLGKVYNNLGILMRRQSNYQKALEYYQKALDYQLEAGDESSLSGLYNNLGVAYRALDDFPQALVYYERSLVLKQKLNETAGVAQAHNNIGLLHLIQGEYDEALESFQKALELKREIGDLNGLANTLHNIGDLYVMQENYGAAEQYLNFAREEYENASNDFATVSVDLSLVDVYLGTNRLRQAQELLNNAMTAVHAKQAYDIELDALDKQLRLDTLVGNFQMAVNHMYRMRSLQDSLFSTDRAYEIARLQTLLEMSEQEMENQQLREDKARQAMEIEENQVLIRKQRSLNISIMVGLVFIIGLALVLNQQRRQNAHNSRLLEQKNEEISAQAEHLLQANEEITIKNSVIEQKNLDITDSLNYASQIQRALLPMNVTLQAYLPEHFIYYQPKDIVSGDFYWFHQIEGLLFLAVIDCTGHGVPGAFMSTLGQQALLTAVVQQRLREPAEILDALKVLIRQMLHQDRNQNSDGMDISLMVIDPKQEVVKFAGAKHSLLYISDGVLNEIKGDRMSVGGENWTVEDNFSQYTITLKKGMTMYMSTDGYKDQFGGKANKKFLSKRVHKLLREIHELPMDEQGFRVEQTIKRWMKDGQQEQVDDMLVWGVRWLG